MIKNFIKLSKDTAFSGTLVVTAGMLLGSVFSYALQFTLSKKLTLADFGTFNALLSLNMLFGVVILVFSTALIKLTSELLAQDQLRKLTALFWKLTIFAFVIGSIVFGLFTLFKKGLAADLNISDPNLFIYFGLVLGMTLVTVIPAAYLQGLLRFKAFALYMFMLAFLRFLVPTVFVYLGYKLVAVFIGIFIAIIMSYIIALLLLKKNFMHTSNEPLTPYFKQLLLFSIPVFFINMGMNSLNNVDVILVKKFFSETESGLYAGIVTIGKILLFGAGTVSAVMFPQISTLFAKKENYLPKFKVFFVLQLLAVLGGVAFSFLFPQFLVLMFTKNFLPAVSYVPRFSVFVGLYVLLNFMVLFSLAINKTKVFAFLVPGVAAQFILILFFHSGLTQIININIGVTLLLLISVILYTVHNVGINNSSGV